MEASARLQSGGIRRLASRVCCKAVHSQLLHIFLPYNQVGVGTQGGLEAAVYSVHRFIREHEQEEDLCCVKIDMRNECDRSTFLSQLTNVLPELVAWVWWCYSCSGELRFGSHRLKSSSGEQQGDPLGALLFSLVLVELMDRIGQIMGFVSQFAT